MTYRSGKDGFGIDATIHKVQMQVGCSEGPPRPTYPGALGPWCSKHGARWTDRGCAAVVELCDVVVDALHFPHLTRILGDLECDGEGYECTTHRSKWVSWDDPTGECELARDIRGAGGSRNAPDPVNTKNTNGDGASCS